MAANQAYSPEHWPRVAPGSSVYTLSNENPLKRVVSVESFPPTSMHRTVRWNAVIQTFAMLPPYTGGEMRPLETVRSASHMVVKRLCNI